VYEEASHAEIFNPRFAIVVIHFVMRLLLIEKKIARQYETGNGEEERHHENKGNEEICLEDGGEDPLIHKKNGAEHKIPSD